MLRITSAESVDWMKGKEAVQRFKYLENASDYDLSNPDLLRQELYARAVVGWALSVSSTRRAEETLAAGRVGSTTQGSS